jgi:hypothetical protein
VAARADVTRAGVTWDSALPAAVFDDLPVEVLAKTLPDLTAALGLVTLFGMTHPLRCCID